MLVSIEDSASFREKREICSNYGDANYFSFLDSTDIKPKFTAFKLDFGSFHNGLYVASKGLVLHG